MGIYDMQFPLFQLGTVIQTSIQHHSVETLEIFGQVTAIFGTGFLFPFCAFCPGISWFAGLQSSSGIYPHNSALLPFLGCVALSPNLKGTPPLPPLGAPTFSFTFFLGVWRLWQFLVQTCTGWRVSV